MQDIFIEVPITKVKLWKKNPRKITSNDFRRLKKMISDFRKQKIGINGQYKPLVCEPKGKKYITLGGNMRLMAYRELDYKTVIISVVKPKNDIDRIKIAMSDNDRAGYYDTTMLRDLIEPFKDQMDLSSFKVDLKIPEMDLNSIFGIFPGNAKEKEVGEDIETKNECPQCGYKW